MYAIYEVKDTFRLPPDQFDKKIEDVAVEILQRKYEGTIDKQLGVVVAVFNTRNISDGTIYAGDPATHHNVEFDLLAYMPYPEEVIAGEVTELVEFGAFVRIGPMEGLVHVSQITNEFLTSTRSFLHSYQGRAAGASRGATCLAKISTVSMKNTSKGFEDRAHHEADGLGKEEWLKRERKEEARGSPGREEKV